MNKFPVEVMEVYGNCFSVSKKILLEIYARVSFIVAVLQCEVYF